MDDSIYGELRAVNRKHFYEIPPFPLDSYRKALNEYKSRKPEKIIRLLKKQ